MTKHEANAALCRQLGVEPKSFGWHSGTPENVFICATCGESDPAPRLPRAWGTCEGKPAYPDLSSADVLMAALRKAGHHFCLNEFYVQVSHKSEDDHLYLRDVSECGSEGVALFRAACAAFGIEINEGSGRF
jgi:hypothetical protein